MKSKVAELIDKLESDVEYLYHNIHPIEIELREKVWKIWMQVIDILPDESAPD